MTDSTSPPSVAGTQKNGKSDERLRELEIQFAKIKENIEHLPTKDDAREIFNDSLSPIKDQLKEHHATKKELQELGKDVHQWYGNWVFLLLIALVSTLLGYLLAQ